MELSDLYKIIPLRKSIRKYDLTPLTEGVLSEISEQMHSLKPLYVNIKTEMKVLSQSDVKNLVPIKAPHYIAVFSEEKDGYLTNVGFMLQQMDLYLSSKGLGACWLGMAKPRKDILSDSKLEFVMILAFGAPSEELHRKSIHEFKRKSMDEITNISGQRELLEAARLAPSATNSQPWFFTESEGRIHVYCIKSSFLKAMLYEKMNKVDCGIALCHLWVTAEYLGKRALLINDLPAQSNPPSGYYYISSLNIL